MQQLDERTLVTGNNMQRVLFAITGIILLIGSVDTFAATYYVKTTGNDSLDGRSHSAAWKSLSKVNSFNFKKGDDVYFLANNNWRKSTLKVDWDGTQSNRVIIGSYYMNNGTEKTGVPSNQNRPIFFGTYTKKGDLVNTSGAIPRGKWAGLVQIDGDYVTFQNIAIKNSAGEGIDVLNAKGGRANHHHVIIENIEVYYTAAGCSTLEIGTHHNIVRNNEFHGCAWGWKNKDFVLGSGWPACNNVNGSHYNLHENNFIHECFGEGIAYLKSDYNIARGNTLVAIRSASIYSDNGQNNIIENNIIIGSPNNSLYSNGASPGYSGSISIAVEDYSGARDSVGNIIRNNLIAYTKSCLGIGIEAKAALAGRLVGTTFVGNTCIAPAFEAVGIQAKSANIKQLVIKNNIFPDPTYRFEKGNCRSPVSKKIIFSNNLWESKPNNSNCNGINDVYGTANYVRQNWGSVGMKSIPKANDFTLKAGSVGKNVGIKITNAFINKADYPFYTELASPCTTLSTAVLTYDHNCNIRSSNSDIGAIDGNSTSNILAPTNLTILISAN